MRHVFAILLICTLALTQSGGCLRNIYDDDSPSSISALPELIIDYHMAANETKFWVKSPITDYRYDSITLTVSNETTTRREQDNYTYSIDLAVQFETFRVNVTARSQRTIYSFSCNCKIMRTELDTRMFKIDYLLDDELEVEEVPFEELPWKIILHIESERNPPSK